MPISRKRNIEAAILALAPSIPVRDLAEIAAHALASKGLSKAAPEKAAWLSLVAYVRHNFTEYEALLDDGYGAEAARHFCVEPTNTVLARWGARRLVDGSAADDEVEGVSPAG